MRSVRAVYVAYLVTILLGIGYVTVLALMGPCPRRAAATSATTA